MYLWDWSTVQDPGARAENFIASHLLKFVDFWKHTGQGKFGIYYLRDKDKSEVDFLITREEQPWFLVEVKYSNNQKISQSLAYFKHQTGAAQAFQVIIDMPYVAQNCFEHTDPIIVPAKTLLSQI